MTPGLDGFEAARELKGDSQPRDIATLMLTVIKDQMGFDFKKETVGSKVLLVDDHCDKPLDYEVLPTKMTFRFVSRRLPSPLAYRWEKPYD